MEADDNDTGAGLPTGAAPMDTPVGSPDARFDPKAPFARRLAALPRLGLGISTEFGAGATGCDVNRLAEDHPTLVQFLEVGADLDRGVDAATRSWVAAGRPTTWHFLDVNLEEDGDRDAAHTAAMAALARSLGAAWMCGDAGLWHIGPRDLGHGVLMPPILCAESADSMGHCVRRLRVATGFEVLPENPPAHVYLGDLHLLDYFARVAETADSGLLLDVAHLAIFQRMRGHHPTDGFDGFPLQRLIEIHVAGASTFDHGGRTFVDDDHSLTPLPETLAILDWLLPRAPNLRAIVFEAERNPLPAVVTAFGELQARLTGVLGAP